MKDNTRPDEFSGFQRRRWIIWASLMTVYVIGAFHRVAPAVIANDLMNTFRMSGTALGALSSSYFYIYAIMQIPSGILADTVGPRKTVALSALVMGAGTVLFALAPSLAYCFAGRFLIGLGVSVVMVNAMKVCVEWYRPAEMGRMNGLVTTVSALGGLLAATPSGISFGRARMATQLCAHRPCFTRAGVELLAGRSRQSSRLRLSLVEWKNG